MKEIQNYDEAVKAIKTAILNSQFDAVRAVNEKQLMLYYGIGKYISLNSRYGYWGKGAIDAISERLDRELPGLKGYSARNLRYMRTFYEEWSFLEENFEIADTVEKKEIVKLESAGSKTETAIWNPLVPKQTDFPFKAFFSIGFSHHRTILAKVKDVKERIFYVIRCSEEKYSREELTRSIERDDYHHLGSLPNNFVKTLPVAEQAFRAINTFKDNGIVEGCFYIVPHPYDDGKTIPWVRLWDRIRLVCYEYIKKFSIIDIGERVFICLSIVGCKGMKTEDNFYNGYVGIIDRDIVLCDPIVIENIGDEKEAELMMKKLQISYLLSIGVKYDDKLKKLVDEVYG